MNGPTDIPAAGEIPSSASTDEIIKRLVVDELYWDARVDASTVLVDVTDGVVTLTGHVPTYADRFSAEADARMIKNVVAVVNRIEVDRPEIIPDRELQDAVTCVLDWAPDVDDSEIEVSSREGTVTLRGSVRRYWEKLRAHLLAASVKGVVHVIDELAVTPSDNVADHEIADHLMQKLERLLFEDVAMVQVTARDGAVTLRGSVPNAAAFQAVQAAAERTVGVVGVRNELTFPHPK